MQASELRIGNYVYINGVCNQVSEIHTKLLKFLSNNTLWNIKQSKPIPLTEEWLVKFGFKTNQYKDEFTLFHNNYEYLLDCAYTDEGVFNFVVDSTCMDIDVKYVHQLQNLYFALTKEELEIK